MAATVCLLLLFAAVASATAGARLERGRELLAEDGGSPPVALSDEQPPDGHLSYRIVKGILEKASGQSVRVDLEKQKGDALKPLMNIP